MFRVTEFPEIVGYDLGDQISLRYVQGDRICTVTQLEGQEPQKDSSDSEDDQGKISGYRRNRGILKDYI